jgi:uncharacterized protein YndB with AHSA1/START domain
MEVQMPYSYTLTSIIPASPQEIYDAWLDSVGHSDMTGSDAVMSDELGAEVSAWNGYISGRNLELVRGQRIVQSWRTSEFGDEHEDSIVTVVLEATDDGTLLTLVHSNVPEEHRSYEEGGWESNYFEPMRAYFGGFGEEEEGEEEVGEEPPQPAAPKPEPKPATKRAPKRAPKPAPKRAAKPAAKVRRAAGKKAKKTPARDKALPAKKKKTKRAAAATKKRKSKTVKKSAKRVTAKRKAGRKKPGRR